MASTRPEKAKHLTKPADEKTPLSYEAAIAKGHTIFHAIRNNNLQLVGEFLSNPIQINMDDLERAVSASDLQAVQELLKSATGIYQPSLKKAVRARDLQAVKSLLSEAIGINCVDLQKRTPLMVAARYGREHIVKFLLKQKKIQVDKEDQRGRTALTHAKERNFSTIVHLLESHRKAAIAPAASLAVPPSPPSLTALESPLQTATSQLPSPSLSTASPPFASLISSPTEASREVTPALIPQSMESPPQPSISLATSKYTVESSMLAPTKPKPPKRKKLTAKQQEAQELFRDLQLISLELENNIKQLTHEKADYHAWFHQIADRCELEGGRGADLLECNILMRLFVTIENTFKQMEANLFQFAKKKKDLVITNLRPNQRQKFSELSKAWEEIQRKYYRQLPKQQEIRASLDRRHNEARKIADYMQLLSQHATETRLPLPKSPASSNLGEQLRSAASTSLPSTTLGQTALLATSSHLDRIALDELDACILVASQEYNSIASSDDASHVKRAKYKRLQGSLNDAQERLELLQKQMQGMKPALQAKTMNKLLTPQTNLQVYQQLTLEAISHYDNLAAADTSRHPRPEDLLPDSKEDPPFVSSAARINQALALSPIQALEKQAQELQANLNAFLTAQSIGMDSLQPWETNQRQALESGDPQNHLARIQKEESQWSGFVFHMKNFAALQSQADKVRRPDLSAADESSLTGLEEFLLNTRKSLFIVSPVEHSLSSWEERIQLAETEINQRRQFIDHYTALLAARDLAPTTPSVESPTTPSQQM